EDLAAVGGVRGGDVEVELEPARPQEGGGEDLHEVGRTDHEDQLLPVEAVHLGQELVDHRVLHAGAGVGAAGRGEGVQFVEDDDGRRRLAGAVEDLPDILL